MAHGVISLSEWRKGRQARIAEDTFGPNPCRGACFENEETGERIYFLCDSPRCVHCGPRKASLLWHHLQTRFGGSAHVAHIRSDSYRAVTSNIRKRRERDGVNYQYAAMDLGNGDFLVVSDCDLQGFDQMALAAIKKRFLTAYQTVRRGLRKSWEIGSVTLSHKSVRKSVTTLWKAIYGKAREYDTEPWMDPTDAEKHRIKRERWLNREATNEWYRQHHQGSTNQRSKNVDRSPQTLPTPWN